MKALIISHEHPDWFKPLFIELQKQGVLFETSNPTRHQYALDGPRPGFDLFFNRMSPSAYLRGGVQGTFYTLNYLKYLEGHGIRVINGSAAYTFEISKALQMMLLQSEGIRYPRSRVVNDASQVLQAARDLRFPIVIKANIGGSGAGIEKFDSFKDLEASLALTVPDFGIDHTALVQEFVPARDGYITRVETLGGKYLYAIRVYTTGESFNLCPADICQTTSGQQLIRNACSLDAPSNGLRVEAFTPPAGVIDTVERIVQKCHIDVGGVEYMTDDRSGEILYYDINALSNFVADASNVIGMNPHEKLVNYLCSEASQAELKNQLSMSLS